MSKSDQEDFKLNPAGKKDGIAEGREIDIFLTKYWWQECQSRSSNWDTGTRTNQLIKNDNKKEAGRNYI